MAITFQFKIGRLEFGKDPNQASSSDAKTIAAQSLLQDLDAKYVTLRTTHNQVRTRRIQIDKEASAAMENAREAYKIDDGISYQIERNDLGLRRRLAAQMGNWEIAVAAGVTMVEVYRDHVKILGPMIDVFSLLQEVSGDRKFTEMSAEMENVVKGISAAVSQMVPTTDSGAIGALSEQELQEIDAEVRSSVSSPKASVETSTQQPAARPRDVASD